MFDLEKIKTISVTLFWNNKRRLIIRISRSPEAGSVICSLSEEVEAVIVRQMLDDGPNGEVDMVVLKKSDFTAMAGVMRQYGSRVGLLGLEGAALLPGPPDYKPDSEECDCNCNGTCSSEEEGCKCQK
jgi:hypothetical protein